MGWWEQLTGEDLGIPGLTDFVEVGSGGFASVYSAHEPDAGRQVAVKVLRAVDGRARERFDRERRTLGMMTEHPHIVTMFRSGFTEHGDHPYLVMEYMPGGSLEDRLQQDRLPTELAIELTAQVADALGFAHRSGVVHKDLKPANILLSRTGVAKLTDFGISTVRDATGTSQLGFSLAYTPPETFHAATAADGRYVDQRDERSDLYSLAATLYALVAGAPPFSAETQATAMHRILTESPAPVGHTHLDRFFKTALAKDPAQRFQTADRFSDALRTSTVKADRPLPLSPPPPSTELPVVVPSGQPNPLAHAAPAPAVHLPNPRQAQGAGVQGTVAPRPSPLAAAPAGSSPPPVSPPRTAGVSPGRSKRPWVVGAIALVALAGMGIAGVTAAGLLDRSPNVASEAQTDSIEATDIDATGPEAADAGVTTTVLSPAVDESAIAVDEDAVSATTEPLETVEPSETDDQDTTDSTFTSETDSDAGPDSDSEKSETANDTTDDTVEGDATDDPPADATDQTPSEASSPGLATDPSAVAVLRRNVRTNSIVELDNGLFATPDFDTGVRIWDRNAPGQDVATYTGHDGGVNSVAALAGGLVASGGTYGDGTIHIWDPSDPGTTIATYDGHKGDAAVTALHQLDNGLVVSGDARGRVQIWDPANPSSAVGSYDGHSFVIITEILQLRNGLVLTNGEADGAHVWDVSDPGSRRAVYAAPGSGPSETYTYEVVELDDGRIAAGTLGGVIHVWNPQQPTAPMASYTGHDEVRSLFGLRGGLVASGGDSGQVHVWDPDDPTDRLLTYSGHQAGVFSIAQLDNGLIASTGSNEVHLWSPYASG